LRPSYSDRVFELPVRGRIVPPIHVSPKLLLFGETSDGNAFPERRFLIRRPDGKAIGEIVNSHTPKGVSLKEVTPDMNGAQSTTRVFSVTLTREFEEAKGNQKITLTLDGEKSPVVVQIARVHIASKLVQD